MILGSFLVQNHLLHPYLLGYIFKYLLIKVSHQILISKMMVEEPTHPVDYICRRQFKLLIKMCVLLNTNILTRFEEEI